jgi:hypothetical protein
VSGVLFSDQEIYEFLDKRTKVAFEAMGRVMRNSLRKSLKMGRRYKKISDIPMNDPWYRKQRILLRIREDRFLRGKSKQVPQMPWIASKPGKVPKIRSKNSPLKRGVLFAFEPGARTLVFGAIKMKGTDGQAPQALEHGGISGINRQHVRKRDYVDRTLKREHKNGKLKRVYAKKMVFTSKRSMLRGPKLK